MGMVSTWAVRVTDWMTFGWNKEWKSAMNPMGDCAWSTGVACHAGKATQYGFRLDGYSETLASTKMNDCTLFFHHNSDKWGKGMIAGTETHYDYNKKSFDSKVGLHMHLDDHSWKFRLHDTGAMRAAL